MSFDTNLLFGYFDYFYQNLAMLIRLEIVKYYNKNDRHRARTFELVIIIPVQLTKSAVRTPKSINRPIQSFPIIRPSQNIKRSHHKTLNITIIIKNTTNLANPSIRRKHNV